MSSRTLTPPLNQFGIGMRVRVKRHVMDPDYPELPLGGWCGRIAQLPERPNACCLVRWSRETLENIHPIYREQCERDDACFDKAWLFAEDLEPDNGGPLAIEHPAFIDTGVEELCLS